MLPSLNVEEAVPNRIIPIDYAKLLTDDQEDCLFFKDMEKQILESEQVHETINDLTKVRDIIDQSVQNGEGLDQAASEMASVAIESALDRIGYKNRTVILSLENVSNKHSRIAISQVSLEGVIDVIKNLAKKLGEMMLTIWKKIKEYIGKLMNRQEHAAKQMQQAQEQVAKLPGNSKPAEEYITTLNVANESSDSDHSTFLEHNIRFGIKGRCDGETALQIMNNTSDLIDSNRVVIINVVAFLKSVCSNPFDIKLIQKESEHLVSEVKDVLHRFTETFKKTQGNQMVYSYGYFHDDHICQLKEDIGKESSDKRARLFGIDLYYIKSKPEEYKVKILSKSEMAQIGKETLSLLEKSRKFDNVVSIVDRTVTSASDKLTNDLFKASLEDQYHDVYQSIELIKDLFNYVKRYLPQLSAASVRVASDATVYVRASVARYSAPS